MPLNPYRVQPPAGAAIVMEFPAGGPARTFCFQAPWRLARGPEVWVAAVGPPSWGGCHVLLSEDDDDYAHVGTIRAPVTMGALLEPLDAAEGLTRGWVSVLIPSDRELPSGDASSVARLQHVCAIGEEDPEFVVYQTARLLAGTEESRRYRLQDALVRGCYRTRARAHPAGAPFLLCDRAVLRVPLERRLLGHPVYLKACAFNAYGESPDDPSEVAPIMVRLRGPSWASRGRG